MVIIAIIPAFLEVDFQSFASWIAQKNFTMHSKHEFWTVNQISTLDAIKGYLVMADLLCVDVIAHQGLIKQIGLAYFPIDTVRFPQLYPVDSFQTRNLIDVTEFGCRPNEPAKVWYRNCNFQSEEVIESEKVPQVVLTHISTYLARSKMNERGVVLIGWSTSEFTTWISKHCSQLLSTGTGCFIGWADVQSYTQSLAHTHTSDFSGLDKTMKALQINNTTSQDGEKLHTRAGNEAVHILQVLVGLLDTVKSLKSLDIERKQKACIQIITRPGFRANKYPFVALLKPLDPFNFLPQQLGKTKSEFWQQFPQTYQPVAIGLERWNNRRPDRKGLELKCANICFTSATETDQFVLEMDGMVLGHQSIKISKLQHPED